MSATDPIKSPILEINELTVAYQHGEAWLKAVRDVTLCIDYGETYGLVGESGSGKTSLVLAVMRYLGNRGAILKGEIFLGGVDLLSLNENELRQVWGNQISFVPQNPTPSLNPSLSVGKQLEEAIVHQHDLSSLSAKQLALNWLQKVHLPDPEGVAQRYPHQISGGMQQRVMIAMALCTNPQLLILDEPTTNLDVTTQAKILDLIHELIKGQNTGVLYVTHNLGVVAQICDRVAVMYASELVEDASTTDLFSKPLHPYTQGLLDSIPRLGDTKSTVQLLAIEGQIPGIGAGPSGCNFRDRCPIAIDICATRPALNTAGDARFSRCHRCDELNQGLISARQLPSPTSKVIHTTEDDDLITLNVEDLSVHYPLRRSLSEVIRDQEQQKVRAVNDVEFEIKASRTFGLVGESGSGKTTAARTIMGLENKTQGSIELLEVPLPEKLSQRDVGILRQLQLVFQHPEEALNPYHPIGYTLRRPLIRLLGLTDPEADIRVAELLEAVRLPANYADRLPTQLSGGEVQRVAIARAFAANPELLILDEPVSSLDVSVQAAILNLVHELQINHGNSFLLISHDITVVAYLADQIAVMYLGSLMEVSGPDDLFQPPHHPYTESLVSSIPIADPSIKSMPVHLSGDIPNPVNIPSGCPFHTRCPRFLGEICIDKIPPWRIDPITGKKIFCHIPLDELTTLQSTGSIQD
jgi:peptide/nickel transport system ATP-binding protein